MHFSKALLVSVIAAVATAQSLPPCAETCAIPAITSSGCSLTDFHCICSSTTYLQSINQCIDKACSASDIAATLKAAQAICLQAGVTITPPTAPPATTASVSSVAQTTLATTASAPYATSNSTASVSPSGTGAVTSSVPFTGGASGLNVAKFLGAVAGFAGLALAL